MELLTVSDLTKYFGADLLFADVSFRVTPREKITLVGGNGSGKTTLLRILLGQIDYDAGSIEVHPSCRLGYLSQDQHFAPDKTLYEEAESVFAHVQEWEQYLHSLEEQMSSADGEELQVVMDKYARATAKFELMDGYNLTALVKRVLFGLGFSESDLTIPAERLSGGQKVRLALAKLLLEAPDVLLLDEPTNHLDLAAVEWLEGYLAALDSAVIVVSHDRFFLDRLGTRTIELENQRAIDYPGNYSFAMAEKERRQAGEMDAYLRQQAEIKKLRAFYEKWRSTPTKKGQAMSRKKKLDKMEILRRPKTTSRTLKFSFQIAEASWKEVLVTEDLGLSFGDKNIFSGANLRVEKGERIALLGPNGAGKTTFLKTINGMLEPTAGRFRWGNRVKIGYFSQQLSGLAEDRTCLEEILQLPGFTRNDAHTLLGQFLFSGDDALKQIKNCSGGERNRLILAKLMVAGANVLLLDEPTNHLDLAAKAALERALTAYQGTVLFVSHDRHFVDQIATKIWEFNDGRVTEFEGNYSAYRAEKERLAALERLAEEESNTIKARQRINPQSSSSRKKTQAQLQQIEAEIEALEVRQIELEETLADPEIYKTADGAQIVAEYNDLLAKLQELYAQWEQTAEL